MPPCRPPHGNSSVCPFTDNGEQNVANRLALKIKIEESYFQGTGCLACHPAKYWHSGGQ